LYLEQKFGLPIEKIPEYIIQGKRTIDRLEDQRLEILRQTQHAREDRDVVRQKRDAFVAELEKYEKEIPSIQRIKELENKLAEATETNKQYEISNRVLTMKLNDARIEATRLEGEAIETDASLKDKSWLLSTCQHELDKLRKSIDKSIIKE
jgi:chromosome segregation ATPase